MPLEPIIRMYIQEMVVISALPKGAADTEPRSSAPLDRPVVERIAGQERRKVRSHRDRAHAGSAAAVRDAEGLVQVQVADVGADVARLGEAGLRVHVGAVHVDLAAGVVDQPADVADPGLEDAVGRRIGDHQRRDAVAMGRPPLPPGRPCRYCPGCRSRRRRSSGPSSARMRGWCRAPTTGSGRRRDAARPWRPGSCGSRAGRRTRPARPSWAGTRRRRSR